MFVQLHSRFRAMRNILAARIPRRRCLKFTWLAGCICGCFVPQANAQPTVAWTNSGINHSAILTEDDNWFGGTVPNSTKIAVFDLPSFTSNLHLQNTDWHVLGIQIGSGAGPLTFDSAGNGGAKFIYLGSTGIVSNSSNTVAFDISTKVNLALEANASFISNGSGPIVVNNSGATFTIGSFNLTLDGTNTSSTISQGFDGSGNVVKAGTGSWTLSSNNIYTGTTTISQGTLNVGNIVVSSGSSNLGNATSAVGLGGTTTNGILAYTGNTAIYTRGFTVNAGGGEFDTTTNGQTVTIDTSGIAANGVFTIGGAGNTTINSVISGLGGIAKTGAGTLVLGGVNTFTGPVTVSAGTLTVNSGATLASNLGTFAPLLVSGGVLNLNNTAQTVASLSGGPGGTINLGTGHTLTDNQAATTSFAGTIAGAGSLVKAGIGTLALSGANTYSGGTTISAGTLSLGVGNALPITSVVNVANGATLSLSNYTTIGSLAGAGSLTGGQTLDLRQNASTTFSGSTGNVFLHLNFASTGTLTLASNYSGRLDVQGGTLAAGSYNALQNANVELGMSGTNSYGATLSFNGLGTAFLGSVSGVGTVSIVGTDLYLSGINSSVFAGTLTSAGYLHIQAPMYLVAGSISSVSGIVISSTLQVGGGPLTDPISGVSLGNNGQGGSISTSHLQVDGTLRFKNVDYSMGGAITGSGIVEKSGTGTLTLSSFSNTYSGGTSIDGGTLSVSSNFNLGASTGTVTFNGGTLQATASFTATRATTLAGGGTFDVANGQILTWNGNITGASFNALTKLGTGTLLLGGSNTYFGDTNVNAGTLQLGAASALSPNTKLNVAPGASFDAGAFAPVFSDLSGSGSLSVGTAGLTVQPSGTSTFTGVLSGSGGFTMSGTGNLTLGAANTFRGATTINSGTVILGIDGALPSGTPVTLSTGAVLDLNGHAATLGSLGGSGNVALGAATLSVAQSGNTTFTGAITGTGGLTKSGTGQLELTGTNTFFGATSITGGQLKLNGSAANSAFTVSGGILSGSGTVGALTLASGGTLSPGNSPGTLNAGNTIWGGGSFQFEINQATGGTAGLAPGWDLLAVTGGLTISSTSGSPFTISVISLNSDNLAGPATAFNASQDYSFTLATTTTGVSTFAADKFLISTTGFANSFTGSWSVALSGNDLNLVYSASAIPEPSAYAALAGTVLLGFAAWRRRRARAQVARH
jgi:fibronectin-binding autotransporter adhesin